MEDLLDKFSSSAPSGGAYRTLSEEEEVLKSTGPPHHPPDGERYVTLFPSSVDRALAPMDDAVMQFVQAAAQGPLGSTVITCAKVVTLVTTVELGLTVPVLLLLLRCADCQAIYAGCVCEHPGPRRAPARRQSQCVCTFANTPLPTHTPQAT